MRWWRRRLGRWFAEQCWKMGCFALEFSFVGEGCSAKRWAHSMVQTWWELEIA